MFRTRLSIALLTVIATTTAIPVEAVIVHHCDYGEHSEQVHNGHGGSQEDNFNDCGNTDENGNTENGDCEHQTAFFWTFSQCTTHDFIRDCQVQGTIDCPAGDKSYSFHCTSAQENSVSVFAGRDHAGCNTPNMSLECNCSSPGYYCSN